MPYGSISELPTSVKKLPKGKQRQWMEVFNSMMSGDDDEGKAMAGAWSRVNKVDMQILSKVEKQRYTLGIVYEPDVEDSQGDYSTAEEIEKACWKFNRKLQKIDGFSKAAMSVFEEILKIEDEPITLDVTDIYDDYNEVIKGDGLNDMHINTANDNALGEIVESYIAPADFTIGEQVVKEGTWLMGVVWNPEHFKKIEASKRTGFSMEGRGRRID